MAFQLEKMNEEDHKKIYTKENVALFKGVCSVIEEWDQKTNFTWAIDRERNVIFHLISKSVPIDTILRYLLIIEGEAMMVQMTMGEEVFPIQFPGKMKNRIDEIKQLIREAFLVYGFFGKDANPNPIDIPEPIFN